MKKLEKMTPEELKTEAKELQFKFDSMTEEEYETQENQKLKQRQFELCEKFEELTGESVFNFTSLNPYTS